MPQPGCAASVVAAFAAAAAGMLRPWAAFDRLDDALHAVHSGHVGDYAVHLAGGVVILGGLTGLAVT